MTTKTTVNYTDEMVAILKDAAPIDYDKAQLLAAQLDRGVRSIIAKCKREGIDYISKPAPAKKKALPNKADTVAGICWGACDANIFFQPLDTLGDHWSGTVDSAGHRR